MKTKGVLWGLVGLIALYLIFKRWHWPQKVVDWAAENLSKLGILGYVLFAVFILVVLGSILLMIVKKVEKR
ncbi:MAG: hypothetical protein CL843_04335 [Crocinitomicaceae bacterium]|nr:hypothetical protein [Crocinitomicaceae bacterium]|tara:strand:- start:1185 stop:1397 length:213 start_codon:yes stop_codon:yes gene_type:complete